MSSEKKNLQGDDLFRNAVKRAGANRQHVKHNASQLKIINGAYNLTKETFIDFDPRKEYWYVPERLFLVGYFCVDGDLIP